MGNWFTIYSTLAHFPGVPVLLFSMSMSSSELFIELDDFAFFSDPLFPFSEQPAGLPDVPQYNDTSAPPCLFSSSPSMEMQGLSLGSSLVATQIPNGSSRTALDHPMNASTFLGENSQSFDSISFERSFGSHSLDRRPSFLVQPNFSSSMFDSPKLRIEAQNPSEHSGLGGPMRRACSTGDLQKFNKMQLAYRSPNQHSHEMMNPSFIEETSSLRVGRYSPEERKQRIHRYIRKRTQRNFNKTIKYACRKTLADSRPRVRGRFARNYEICDIPKAANHAVDEDEDLWIDEIHDIVGRSSDGWNLDF